MNHHLTLGVSLKASLQSLHGLSTVRLRMTILHPPKIVKHTKSRGIADRSRKALRGIMKRFGRKSVQYEDFMKYLTALAEDRRTSSSQTPPSAQANSDRRHSVGEGQINLTKEEVLQVKIADALLAIEEKHREVAKLQSQVVDLEAKTKRTTGQLDSMTRTHTELHQQAQNHKAQYYELKGKLKAAKGTIAEYRSGKGEPRTSILHNSDKDSANESDSESGEYNSEASAREPTSRGDIPNPSVHPATQQLTRTARPKQRVALKVPGLQPWSGNQKEDDNVTVFLPRLTQYLLS